MLLNNGSDPNTPNKDGKTARDLALSEEVRRLFPVPKEEEIILEDDDE